jgi:hypothetical protein
MRSVAENAQRVVDEARSEGLFGPNRCAQRGTQITLTGRVDTPDDSCVEALDEDLQVCSICGDLDCNCSV